MTERCSGDFRIYPFIPVDLIASKAYVTMKCREYPCVATRGESKGGRGVRYSGNGKDNRWDNYVDRARTVSSLRPPSLPRPRSLSLVPHEEAVVSMLDIEHMVAPTFPPSMEYAGDDVASHEGFPYEHPVARQPARHACTQTQTRPSDRAPLRFRFLIRSDPCLKEKTVSAFLTAGWLLKGEYQIT